MKNIVKSYKSFLSLPFNAKKLLTLGGLFVLAVLLPGLVYFSQTQKHENVDASTLAATDFHGLKVVGNTIQNAAGQVVTFHGVNRSSAEYTCFDGSGDVFDAAVDQTEVNAMKSWNINAVRVVLNEDCWLGINGVTVGGAPYQTAIRNYVKLLTQNNMAVVVNLHFNAPGSVLAREQEPMADRDHSLTFWASVSAQFKDNSMVMFEPYNEPHLNDVTVSNGTAWPCWRDGGCSVKGTNTGDTNYIVAGMQEMVNAIRGTGANNIIIVTGEDWGADLSGWDQYKPVDPVNQLAAGWHSYGDGLSCQTLSCWNTTLASVTAKTPLLATEIGEFDCKHTYIDQVMNFLDSKGQSYFAWAWGPYNCSQDPALISNWNGIPTQTFGQGFKDHLLQFGLPSPTTDLNSTATPTPVSTVVPTTPPTIIPTATRVPTPTKAPTPTPTPVASSNVIYLDSLQSGWVNGTYGGLTNFALVAPVYQGTSAISFTQTKKSGGLEFDYNAGTFNTTGYVSVQFAAKASQAGQKYAVFLSNASFKGLTNPISLASYGGDPNPSTWTLYTIPLVNLNGANKAIKALTIAGNANAPQPAVYIDQVQFVR